MRPELPWSKLTSWIVESFPPDTRSGFKSASRLGEGKLGEETVTAMLLNEFLKEYQKVVEQDPPALPGPTKNPA